MRRSIRAAAIALCMSVTLGWVPMTGGGALAATPSVTQAIYFVPSDKPNQGLHSDGTIGKSLDSIRSWFSAQMGKVPRFARVGSGSTYDIAHVRGEKEAAAYDSLDTMVEELTRRSLVDESSRYLLYAAISRGSICGEAQHRLHSTLDVGRFAVVYLDSDATCGARDFGGGTAASSGKTETIAVHEWLHNEGLVPVGAPHYCAAMPWPHHVCTGPLWLVPEMDPEAPDVLFPLINAPLASKVLDRDRDDYLDHGLPHLWNLRDSPWLE